MESVNFTALAGEPCDLLPTETLKPFDAITHLLEIRTRRQPIVSHAPETAPKAATTLVGSILLDAGNDAGNALGAALERSVHALLKEIRATPDPVATLDWAIGKFDPANRETPLKVHHTTVAGMVPDLTRAEMDHVVGDQYVEQMGALGSYRARSPKMALAIDNTSQRVEVEHPNGGFSPVKVGGRVTWEQGFRYATQPFQTGTRLSNKAVHKNFWQTTSHYNELNRSM